MEMEGKQADIIKIAAFCGSLRKSSFHRGLIRYAPLKFAIDWASIPPNVWAKKAAAVISTGGSLGGGRAQYHLRQIGVYLDLHFINKPEFFLRAFEPPQKFDGDGNLIDEEAKKGLKEVIEALQDFALQLKA